MSQELPKAYDPSLIEEKWAQYWVEQHLFDAPTPAEKTAQKTFTILLPPPNVTGRLHMGHMLNQTEMDILTRWHRMRGELANWVPGTDHAGIATQMMVERQLVSENTTRQAIDREAFVERVWKSSTR
jgi:valyl-tRNA synthetase